MKTMKTTLIKIKEIKYKLLIPINFQIIRCFVAVSGERKKK